jgi:hypothetical protein
MKSEELYALLEANGIDFEIIEIFEGVRLLSIQVNDEWSEEEGTTS